MASSLEIRRRELADRLYAEAEAELAMQPFAVAGPQACREAHERIITFAVNVLHERGYRREVQTAAALLMAMEVKRVSQAELAEGFGERIAAWVMGALPPSMEGLDEVAHWQASLAAFTEAPSVSQTLRLALLLGQLEVTPEPLWQWPFWAEEAAALQGADEVLRCRVYRRLGWRTWNYG